LKKIVKYIQDFFEPKALKYEIKLATSKVIEKFNLGLDEGSDTPKIKGLVGTIDKNEFTMGAVSTDPGGGFNESIRGTLIETRPGITQVNLFIIRSSSSYMTFFLSFLAFILYLGMYYLEHSSKKALVYGFAALILGTLFSIWLSNSALKTLQRQFESFLQANSFIYENCS